MFRAYFLLFCRKNQVKGLNNISSLYGQPRITKDFNKMSDPVVEVSEGKLKGAVRQLYNGSNYYSFKGIPYAQPPVGSLRFKAPLPPKPWEGIRDATKHGSVCPQYDITTGQKIDGNENCLFINVYTKSLKSETKIPVMVFIHGGGFMSGSGNSETLGPDYLLQHDVILVTFNYRLEVLGFLCLDTPEVPGNAGMKDQVAAMRWVKKNIAQFGGDPDNITLFGESAGGSSVTYHMISSMSQGLFNKAIAQSGVCTQEWAKGVDAKERAIRTGKFLGKNTEDTTELLEFLQGLPVEKLRKLSTHTTTFDEQHRGLPLFNVPVVEKKFDGIEQFLTEEPMELMLANKLHDVPLMLGFNSNEGLMNVKVILRNLDFFNKNPRYLVPRDVSRRVSVEKEIEMGKEIVKFYSKTGTGTLTKEDAPRISDMCSDNYFTYNVLRFAHIATLLQKQVYLYRFDIVTELNLVKQVLGVTNYEGACHADDLFYIFSNIMTKDTYLGSERLQNLVFEVTKLWTNFAKHGNPTPAGCELQWPRYTNAHKHFLHLSERSCIQRDAYRERTYFLNKLVREAGLPCIARSSL